MVDDLEIIITAVEPPEQGNNVTLRYGNDTQFSIFSLAAVNESLTQLKTELTKTDPAPSVLKAAGIDLFAQLLGDQLASAYTRATTQSAQQGHKLRLRIVSDQPDVIAVPWEYLYDQGKGQWLALHREISLVRGLPLAGRDVQPITGPLRVLVMASDPTDLPRLNSARELANLEKIAATGMIDLHRIAPSYEALQNALRQDPHVFHFIGHGTFPDAQSGCTAGARHLRWDSATDDPPKETQGMLAFCRTDGTAYLIEADRLAPLLAGCETLGLVLLNACEGAVTSEQSAFAGLTQRLIQQQVPAVIAMQAPIVDDHALHFSQEFYAALADGRDVEQAVDEGRMSIHGNAYT